VPAGTRALVVAAAALLATAESPADASDAAARSTAAASPAARTLAAGAPPLRVEADAATGRLVIRQAGRALVAEHPGTGAGASGRLGFRAAGRWHRATRALAARSAGGRLRLRLATTDPARRELALVVARDRPGALRLRAAVTGDPGGVEAVGLAAAARPGERFLGFGERANAVDQRGRVVESFVADGPYRREHYPAVLASIPPWALRRRADATYFPMPWLLSTRGFGVLVDDTVESRYRLGSDRRDAWSVEVDGPRMTLRVLGGPRVRDVVRRLLALTGRQPRPAAPWQLGPWFQTGHANEEPAEQEHVRRLRAADAPISAVETHMRYMPCGADRGREAAERTRTAAFHAQGLAALTYMREAVCADDPIAFGDGVARGAFLRRADGMTPYAYVAFVGGRTTPVAQIDFTSPSGEPFHASLLARAVANGYDGWMEDYGEYTPPDSRAADGTPGTVLHNLYPVQYHRSGQRFAEVQSRPIVRFVRSGWTGVHRYAPVVWGGDPTTGWAFDGLRSAVRQALTMGLSGITHWGSDIGGFFTLGRERLTPELLARWIQFGAISGVMRTKAEGIGVSAAQRPQVWEQPTLPIWRRYAKLRTQLYPYLVAADREYRRTGLPLMRHLALTDERDPVAAGRDDEFRVGPDLLAAPVTTPGARTRRLYLPAGGWVDLWRAAAYRPRTGGLRLGAARVLRGGRAVTVPAPLDELPLLARAGALLPLLPADVDTLAAAPRGRPIVGLRDRRNRLELLALPRGRGSARFDADGRLRSLEGRGRWTLAVAASRARSVRLQASLRTLRRPFRPRSVTLGGRPLARRAWRFDGRTGVLRARFSARRATLVVRRRATGR
jgi:alpha-glucosidase (family GH31 glycosyl hydrolase)